MFVEIFLHINFVKYKECSYKECHGTDVRGEEGLLFYQVIGGRGVGI
jgi:hypothetical protein